MPYPKPLETFPGSLQSVCFLVNRPMQRIFEVPASVHEASRAIWPETGFALADLAAPQEFSMIWGLSKVGILVTPKAIQTFHLLQKNVFIIFYKPLESRGRNQVPMVGVRLAETMLGEGDDVVRTKSN